MKFILTTLIVFTAISSSASEVSTIDPTEGLVPVYCGDPLFLTCVDLKKKACEIAFKKSSEKCESEKSALRAFVEKESSPFDTSEKLKKAKRDFGKCTVEGLYGVVKKDLVVSCINSSGQRLIEKLEKKYSQRRKKEADRKSAF